MAEAVRQLPVAESSYAFPASVEAEEGVIGACLIDARASDVAFEIVEPRDFYRENHRLIAEALYELRTAGDPIDLTTVVARLQENGNLKPSGGTATLAEITERVPTAAHVAAYARTVRRLSYRRKLIANLESMLAQVRQDGRPIDEYMPDSLTEMIDVAADASAQREKHAATVLRVASNVADKQTGKVEPAIPTGLRDLDRMIGGTRLGHLVIIGALSSHGKTSLATQMIEEPLRRGVGVGIISADTDKSELLQRIAGQRSGVCTQDILDGALRPDDMVKVNQALDELYNEPLEIVDSEYDWPRIKVSIRRMVAGGARIIVIDHLTLLRNPAPKGKRDYWEEMAGISRDVQQIARAGVCVYLLVQVNLKAEGRARKKTWRPHGGLLKGTGASYENANTVLMPYWPGKDYPVSTAERSAEGWDPYEIRVDKQKMGPTGKVDLWWHPESMRLHDFTGHAHPDDQYSMP